MSLEMINVDLSYKKHHELIIDNASLMIQPGELVVIRGESGSGKSTLLACIAGILKPKSGKVKWKNNSIYDLADKALSKIHKHEISYVPQTNIFLQECDILENIFWFAGDNKVNENKKEEALKILKELNVEKHYNRFPRELSGGELKRVSIARAVFKHPEVLIVDEPTTGLDINTGEKVMKYLSAYAKAGNIVIIASHDSLVSKYSKKQYCLTGHKVLREGYN